MRIKPITKYSIHEVDYAQGRLVLFNGNNIEHIVAHCKCKDIENTKERWLKKGKVFKKEISNMTLKYLREWHQEKFGYPLSI